MVLLLPLGHKYSSFSTAIEENGGPARTRAGRDCCTAANPYVALKWPWQERRGPRSPRSDLRRVHRGLRHARLEGDQNPARRWRHKQTCGREAR